MPFLGKKYGNMATKRTSEESEQIRIVAKDYWLYSPYTQKEIAEKVGVAEHTILAWRKTHGWDEQKEALLKIADKRFRHYVKLLDIFSTKIEQEEIDVDELTKLQSLIEKNSIKGTELSDVEKVGLSIIKYLDEVMPDRRDFYLNFYRSFAEWVNTRKTV